MSREGQVWRRRWLDGYTPSERAWLQQVVEAMNRWAMHANTIYAFSQDIGEDMSVMEPESAEPLAACSQEIGANPCCVSEHAA